MSPLRAKISGILTAVAVVGALLLGFFNRDPDPATAQQLADAALEHLDHRTAQEALAARCAPDSGESGPLTSRTCAALADLATLQNEPLAGATRLADLAKTRTRGKTARDLVAEVQAIRVELLLQAGHSKEAAMEAQAWAEDHQAEDTVDSVRLWVAAAKAQHEAGFEETARDDARLALQLARRAH